MGNMNQGNNEADKYSPRKVSRIIVIGLLITISILFIIISQTELKKTFSILANVNVKYLFIAIAILLVHLILRPITLVILSRSNKMPLSNKRIFIINMTEPFFDGITPFATGGQPFEIYAMTRFKVKGSQATSILMMNLIVTMVATDITALLSLSYINLFFPKLNRATQILVSFGFIFLILVLVLFLSIGVSKHMKTYIIGFFKLLSKIKILNKFIEKKIPGVIEFMESFQTSFKQLLNNYKILLVSVLIKIVTLFLLYTIPYFVIKALYIEITVEKFLPIVAATAFVTSVVTWLPTPGSSGGIEYFFKEILFIAILGSSVENAAAGMLIWRLITYYLLIFIGFIFYIALEFSYSSHLKKTRLRLLSKLNIDRDNQENTLNEENQSEDSHNCEEGK